MTTVRALRTFASLEGRIRPGHTLETTDERAAYLVSAGLAEMLDGPASTQVASPPRRELPEPSEVNHEIKAVGGGWYEWRGKRYRGRPAAETAKNQEG